MISLIFLNVVPIYFFLFIFINTIPANSSFRDESLENYLRAKASEIRLIYKEKDLPKIFICYSSDEDKGVTATKIWGNLGIAGIPYSKILLDIKSNKAAKGRGIRKYIENIKTVERVIVIGSPSLKQKYGRDMNKRFKEKCPTAQEITHLLNHRPNRMEGVIPIWFSGEVQECFPPAFLEPPNDIPYIDFRTKYDKRFKQLLDALLEGIPAKRANRLLNLDYTLPESAPRIVIQITAGLFILLLIFHPYLNLLPGLLLAFGGGSSHEANNQTALLTNPIANYNNVQPTNLTEPYCKNLPFVHINQPIVSRQWRNVTPTVPLGCSSLPDRLLSSKFIESSIKDTEENRTYLTLLWEAFHKYPTVSITSAFIEGMGGIGKTTLALAYAWEAHDNKAYDLIYWLNSETEDSLFESYKKLLRKLNPEFSFKEEDTKGQIIDLVKEHIAHKQKWLLIFDNVPDPDFLDNKVPQSAIETGHILVTTRYNREGEDHSIKLDVFSQEEAVDYLFRATKFKATPENQNLAYKIAEELGGLPLALSHAASYINYRPTLNPFEDYLTKLKSDPANILGNPPGPYKKSIKLTHEYFVGKTLRIAAEVISPLAKELMVYMAYLNPSCISNKYFIDSNNLKREMDDSFASLRAFSLITGREDCLSMHRLVQFVVRNEQEEERITELPFVFSKILTKFQNYKESIGQTETSCIYLVALNLQYDAFTAIRNNLKILYGHTQRLSTKLQEETNLHLKYANLILQQDVENSLVPIRKKLITALEKIKGEIPLTDHIEQAVNDEIQILNLFLTRDEYQKIKEYLPTIMGLPLKNEGKQLIVEAVKFTLPSEGAMMIKNIQDLLSFTDIKDKRFLGPHVRVSRVNLIVKALSDVPSSQRHELIKALLPLLTFKKISEKMRTRAVQALVTIEPQRRGQWVDSFLPFLEDDTEFEITEDFLSLTPQQTALLMEGIQPLITSAMRAADKAPLLRTFLKIKPGERKVLIDEIKTVLTEQMDGHARSKIVRAFINFDSSQYKAFMNRIKPILILRINEHERAEIIEYLSKLEDFKQTKIIEYVYPILSLEMQRGERIQILRNLSEIPLGQYRILLEEVVPILKADIRRGASFVKSFLEVTPQYRYRLIEDLEPLFGVIQDVDEQAQILRIFADVMPSQRPALIEEIRTLLSLVHIWCPKPSIIKYYLNIDSDKRIDLLREMEEVLPFKTNEWDIISAFSNRMSSERRTLLKDIEPLIKPDMQDHEIGNIIDAFLEIATDQRLTLIKEVQSLLPSAMNTKESIEIIQLFLAVDQELRESLVREVAPMLTTVVTRSNCLMFIKIFIKLPVNYRMVWLNSMHYIFDSEKDGLPFPHSNIIIEKILETFEFKSRQVYVFPYAASLKGILKSFKLAAPAKAMKKLNGFMYLWKFYIEGPFLTSPYNELRPLILSHILDPLFIQPLFKIIEEISSESATGTSSGSV